jgi:Ion channel
MRSASTTAEQLDRRALTLLGSVGLYMVLSPALENHPVGSLILIVLLYAILVAAILQLAAIAAVKRWLLLGVPLAGLSMGFIVLSHIYPTRLWIAINQSLLLLFFTLVSTCLFFGLGRSGAITKGRLFTSVSLYLILAMVWALVYGLIETVHPGSFTLMVGNKAGPIPRSIILYMSLVCLTTLGTGDLVPASDLTRMLVGMESVNGVMYVAVTIARLVSAYPTPDQSRH